jgi:DNA mismatch repair protein MutL
VEVRDLFGAVPARRKFLRAESTETAHVAEAITLLALARPGVGFFLHSGGRPVIEAPAAPSLGPRVYQIFGARFLEGLLEVDGGEEWARVSGFVSRPDGPRPARPSLRLFVNHRAVRDRALAKAVSEAYRKAGVGSGGFEAILFVDVPPAMVDVNVHPAKTEVRFAEGRTVFTAVEKSVRAALAEGGRQAPRADTRRVEAAVQTFLATEGREGIPRASSYFAPGASFGGGEVSGTAPGAGQVAEPPRAIAADAELETGGLRVLGQHRNTYIVASDGEDIVLVDQHTAHERVRFERVVAGLEARAAAAQLLLTPVVVKLPPALLPLLEAQAENLLALGYEVEAFGGGSTRLRSVPALLAGRDPSAGLEALLRDFQERGGEDWAVSGSRDRLAATVACHSAVRAGQALAHDAMAAIVRDLRATRHPTLCPHGRPTLVRIPREDVSRWFGRVGWRRQ